MKNTSENINARRVLLPVFVTVFIDMMGGGIPIPIMPSLILTPETAILSPEVGPELRKIIFGFLTGAFFLAQFIGAPILGAISDRDGRRKVLMISLGGTVVGYLLFALGIYLKSLPILFISRVLAGFMGGNISVALSVISDVSTPENKTKNFGLIGAAFGLGFIFGPALGGMLSDSTIYSGFGLITPFLVSALFTSLNILLANRNIPETIRVRSQRKVNLLTGIDNIRAAFYSPTYRMIFGMVFCITFGFALFTQFFNVFLTEAFQMDRTNIGWLFSYVGIWSVIAQGALVRPLSKKFRPVQILSVSLFVLSLFLVLIILPQESWYMYLIIPFIASSQGMTQPNVNTIITNASAPEAQGQILGISQSVQSLAMAIPPMLAGFLSNINIRFPNYIAAICMLGGWAILYFRVRKNQTST